MATVTITTIEADGTSTSREVEVPDPEPTAEERIAELEARIDKVIPPVSTDGEIDPTHQVDDPLAAEVARLSSLLEAALADPEIAKVADIEAIRTAADSTKGDDALVLAVAKQLGADPAEVRKKRDADPTWFADVVAKYGLDGGKGDGLPLFTVKNWRQ